MKSKEKHILYESEYYIHTSNFTNRKAFFYVTSIGHFFYDTPYTLTRNNENSFLIIYVKNGNVELVVEDTKYVVGENQVIFLDCNKLHSYSSITPWEALWFHFDGPVAKEYFDIITKNNNPIIDIYDNLEFLKTFVDLFKIFQEKQIPKDAIVSKYICDLLTKLIISSEHNSLKNDNHTNIIEDAIKYMNENINENISLLDIASHVSLSEYYFTRLFKKQTNISPHQYLIAIRLDLSKFLLKNTTLSVKEICYECGFNSVSNFCYTFKQHVGLSPTNFREQHHQSNL